MLKLFVLVLLTEVYYLVLNRSRRAAGSSKRSRGIMPLHQDGKDRARGPAVPAFLSGDQSMSNNAREREHDDEHEFIRLSQEPAPGALQEMWLFLRETRKWWLAPILLTLLLLGGLISLGSSAAAPLIYALF